MARAILLIAVSASTLLLSSCAESTSETKRSSDQVSTIPWNRPERWEGQGMMPGFQAQY